ncbi:histidine--tRNA ligase [bacterium]|nr:histidine--tRNA ligase [bacterium]
MARTKPRLYRGFRDVFAADVLARNRMINTVRQVYERYGFVPLETPAIEYVEVLGKFLPESTQPDGGIFSLHNEDEEWIALRYDLTAPLSRVVSMYPELPRPFRRYQVGPVYRFEKPGPGRFREFYQFDFDSVGVPRADADAEICCVMADTLEAVGIQRGDYIIKVNDRKILNGILELTGYNNLDKIVEGDIPIGPAKGKPYRRQITSDDIFRAIDKLDKVGIEGVELLLTGGRLDESGDYTPGCELSDDALEKILGYLNAKKDSRKEVCDLLAETIGDSEIGKEGVEELRTIDSHLTALGYDESRVIFDPTVVRGLSYYTGPVFEGELTFEVTDESGNSKSFGSVFGGGRYDDLVKRFTGQMIPATGASIGVDRLLAALKHLGRIDTKSSTAHVLVTVMDKNFRTEYHKLAHSLRQQGINTEVYMAGGNIGKQLKYADKANIPIAIIAGDREFEDGKLQIKDLWLGRDLSEEVEDRETWRTERPAQFEINADELLENVKTILNQYKLL